MWLASGRWRSTQHSLVPRASILLLCLPSCRMMGQETHVNVRGMVCLLCMLWRCCWLQAPRPKVLVHCTAAVASGLGTLHSQHPGCSYIADQVLWHGQPRLARAAYGWHADLCRRHLRARNNQ